MSPLKYDPARWICQCKSSICDGIFYVYSEARPCPLWPKCRGNSHQLEYLYAQQSIWQRKLHLSDPQRYLEHAARSRDLRRVFVPEKCKAENRACYERNKDRYSAIAARKYREAHLHDPPKAPKYDIPLPPCGRACEEEDGSCPYDDDCHYPDWEETHIARLQAEKKAAQRERINARRRERMATDPVFAEKARESKRKAKRIKAEKAAKDAAITPEERKAQQEQKAAAQKAKRREQAAARQAVMTPEEQEAQKAKKRERNTARWANLTPEEREANRAAQREYYRARRDADPEAAKATLASKWRELVESETPEEKEARLAKKREQDRRRRAEETPIQREARLAKERERRRAKDTAMTPEEREIKNAKQRARYWLRKDRRKRLDEMQQGLDE